MSDPRRTLTRNLRVGDELKFDNGRISIRLIERSGRSARLRCEMKSDVVVDKPTEDLSREKQVTTTQ